ncbi:MAG: heparan-alpha-glucosaminide N-acetyltransferase domain-containing protein [Promethearchaeati archaeon]
MSNRIGSVDFFRGFCMFLMLLGHLSVWLMSPAAFQIQEIFIWIPLEPIAKGTGFILISGTSIALFFSKRKVDLIDPYDEKTRILRNSSYFRAFILFLVAFIMNIALLSSSSNAKIYDWWILFTLSICLIFSWPLMKLSINQRILFGIVLLVFNYFFQQILLYGNFSDFSSFLLDFFYPSDSRQNPLLLFFPFFLFGTIIGSFLVEKDFGNNEDFLGFLKKIFLPLALPSVFSILFGIFLDFPNFLTTNSFSYIIYALGLNSLIVSILLTLEKATNINFNSKYNPLFYFSYYSLTFYLLHYSGMLFGFLSLNYWTFWLVFGGVLVILTVFLHIMYRFVAGLFSLKYFVSILGEYFSLKIEEIFYKHETSALDNLTKKLKLNISSNN